MLPITDLNKLAQRFPNGRLGQFHVEPLWILDTEGEFIGYISIQDGEFCLLKDYPHRVKAEQALKGVKYRVVDLPKSGG